MTEITRLGVGCLIDGLGGDPTLDAAVLIADGRIEAMGPDVLVPVPENTRRIDWPWATALPGLIDTHVHVTLSTSDDPVATLGREDDVDLVVRGVANAERLLRSGITTAVDRGARNGTAYAVRDALRRHLASGPRLLVCGRPITRTGGHTHHLNGVADGVDGVREAVRERVEEGADAIKIIATGGMLTPSTNPGELAYPIDVLTAAAEEAHRAGLKIAAHAHALDGIRACIEAGVDSIEHATMLDRDGRWSFDVGLADAMARRGTVAVPGVADSLDNSRRLLDAGVRLVAGTDVGVDGTDFTCELIRELRAFVQIGSTPLQAIRAATLDAANALGLGDGIGRLEVGGAADVFVVRGRPDREIEALASPALIFLAGRPIQPTIPARPAQTTTLAAAGF